MSKREGLIKAMESYFRAGCKEQISFGLEAEHFVVDARTKKAIPYKGADGVEGLLTEISPHFEEEICENGNLIGLRSEDAIITLEPGSQLEVSVTQSADIAEIRAVYEKYFRIIEAALAKRGQALVTAGYQPMSCVSDIALIPKMRYAFMDEHFKHTGSMGINMMRGTASCQVSLDYTDEADFTAKYRSACIISPILALITSNSPSFEGQANDNPLIRTRIWNNVDSARAGILTSAFEDDFSFRAYAEYVLNQTAIFEQRGDMLLKSERSAAEVLCEYDTAPDTDKMVTYMSLVFPDIRLRQYIEIRVADSMPIDKTIAYITLIKGLFADAANLNKWSRKLCKSKDDITAAQQNIMRSGAEAVVYGKPVMLLIDELFGIAMPQLSKNEKEYIRKGFDTYEH